MKRLVAAVLALGLLVSGCVSAERYDASADIRAFLIAVRDGDRATFDAHVDRDALKTNLKARLLAAQTGRSTGAAVAALLAGPLVDVAVDAFVRPEVFRAAAARAGYGPDTKIPGPLVIGHEVRALDADRVCVQLKGACSFVFKREDGVWRLIDYAGDLSQLQRLGHARG